MMRPPEGSNPVPFPDTTVREMRTVDNGPENTPAAALDNEDEASMVISTDAEVPLAMKPLPAFADALLLRTYALERSSARNPRALLLRLVVIPVALGEPEPPG